MAYCLFGILPNDGLVLKFRVLIFLVSAATMSGKQVRICKKAGLDEKTKIRPCRQTRVGTFQKALHRCHSTFTFFHLSKAYLGPCQS